MSQAEIFHRVGNKMYNPELKRDAAKEQCMWTAKLHTVIQGCIAFYADSKRIPLLQHRPAHLRIFHSIIYSGPITTAVLALMLKPDRNYQVQVSGAAQKKNLDNPLTAVPINQWNIERCIWLKVSSSIQR